MLDPPTRIGITVYYERAPYIVVEVFPQQCRVWLEGHDKTISVPFDLITLQEDLHEASQPQPHYPQIANSISPITRAGGEASRPRDRFLT